MSKLISALAAAMLLAGAFIGSAVAQDMPNLVGTWQGQFRAQLIGDITTGTMTMVIDSQDGELFTGGKMIARTDDSSALISAQGQLTRNADERFIGVISADGTQLHIAEQDDPGWYVGRVIDADTIELTYVESGEVPVVHRTTLARQD